MKHVLSRREALALGTALVGTALEVPLMSPLPAAATAQPSSDVFRFCLNTSTIQGQKLSLVEEIEIAAKAGYHAIEPWVREVEKYVEDGGSLKDLDHRIKDRGLTVESVIGFAEWVVDDDARRAKGLEHAKRDLELVAQIGAKHLAAPPMGATDQADFNLHRAAERYRALCDLADPYGVVPMVEVWGFSKSLTRLSDAAFVAIESGHPKACILPDVYHLYKGGSDINGLRLLSRGSMHVFHLNDYPADPPRASINDSDRVYPGDGVAPYKAIFTILREIGYNGVLSIELFNHTYWKQDALLVAKTALEKARSAVRHDLS